MTLTGKLHRCNLIMLLLTGLLVGCTGFKIENGNVPHGFLFYLPKPYLLVEGSYDTPRIRVVYLPDYAHPQSIVPRNGKSFDAGLDLGTLLRSLTADGGAAPPPAEEKADAAPDTGTGHFPRRNLAPGLYEIVFDQGKLSSLRHIDFPVTTPGSSAMGVQDLRFVADPVTPEIPKEVVLTIVGSAMLSCPPPELKVKGQLKLDGEREEDLCRNGSATCDATAQEVHCRLSLREAGVYEARAWTEQGGHAGSVVEGSFPESPEGFAPFSPQATVSFGRTEDGSVRTIGIVFDRQSGSCLLKRDLESMVELYGKEGGKVSQIKLGDMSIRGDSDCMTDVLYYLKEPRREVSVRVRPQNRLGLVGKTVVAAAETPPATASSNPTFAPTISPISPWASLVFKNGLLLSSVNPLIPKGLLPSNPGAGAPPGDLKKGELTSVRGALDKNSLFSEFEMEFTAPQDSLPKIGFCQIAKPPRRALQIEKDGCCPKGVNLEPLQLKSLNEISHGRYRGSFSLPPRTAPSHLCFRVVLGTGVSFFSSDDSLLSNPQQKQAGVSVAVSAGNPRRP
jgi:hypothetical protein